MTSIGFGFGIGWNQRRRGSSFTLPSITSFSVGPQDGADLPVSINIVEGTDPPQDLFIVAVPDGAGAPSAAQIAAGQDSTGAPAPAAVSVTGVTSGNVNLDIDPTPADGTYDFYAVVVDSEGRPSNVASALGVAWAAPSVEALTWIGFQTSNESGSQTTHTYTVTITEEMVGRFLIFGFGSFTPTTEVSIDSKAATLAGQSGSTAGARVSVWTYLCEAEDVGSLDVVATTEALASAPALACAHSAGPAVPPVAGSNSGGSHNLDPRSATLTPPAGGAVFAFAGSWAGGGGGWIDEGQDWTNAEWVATSVSSGSVSVAFATDLPNDPITITFTPDGDTGRRNVIIAAAFEGP